MTMAAPLCSDRVHLSVEAVPAGQLTTDHVAAWEAILVKAPLLRSPFLAPGWTRLLAECRDDVMVGVMRRGGQIVALLPYELGAEGEGRPVGNVFNDYQAVIALPAEPWTPEQWLAGLGLTRMEFTGWLALQDQMTPYAESRPKSFAVALEDGFEPYVAWLRQWRPSLVEELRSKTRRLEREVGALRFTSHLIDHELLDHALRIKARQWADSGWPGRFFAPWEYKMMHALLEWDEPSVAGLFSVLWAGEHPIAFHFGMRGRQAWHGWTIVHDPAFARYSPGMLIHMEMFKSAQGLGLDEFDLGMGEYPHKRRMQTHQVPLVRGSVKRG